MKNYLLLAFAAVALLFAGCKKDDPGTDEPKVVAVTGVSLNTNAVALEVDDSVTLTATVAPANATNKSVEWSVADDAIATVENGVVKAVAIGETTVTVTTVDGGFTASATITVAEGIIKVTGVTLDKPSLELEIGDSDTLTATVAPANATNKAVSWSSANDAIATVEDGVVTAVAAGETTVTVTTADGAFKATANVVVKAAPIKVTGVSLDQTMVTLEIGESVTVEATVTPETAVNKAVEWSIADTSIATVIDGVVTGVAAGKTELTVTTADGGHTATIPVKVVTERVAVEELIIIGGAELQHGEKCVMGVKIKPSNATNQKVSFTCSPELVSIEENTEDSTPGMIAYDVTPLGEGEVTFTAVSEDGGITATKNIAVSAPKGSTKVTEIRIGPENATIAVGETKQFAAAISPSDAENKEVEWSSSDTAVATIDANGLVTGVGKGTATITATAKDGSGVKGETTITVVGKMPTALTINGEKTPDPIYTWHGKEVTLDLACTPANADISRLYWDIYTNNYSANADAVKYEFTANTLKLSFEHSQSTSGAETIYIRAYDSEKKSIYYGGINVDYQTLSWLFDARYEFSVGSSISSFAGIGDDMEKFNWNKDDYTSGLNFIAYYYTNGLASVVSPYSEGAKHYYEYYIPSSEYTLTSSDESKIKVTKNDDGKSWKIERLNTTDLVAVTLTYKCGDHTQTYTINLIP